MARNRVAVTETGTGRVEDLNHEGWGVVRAGKTVFVAGALPGKPLPDGSPGPSLYCAVIVKRVDAQTRAKTSINELLRD